MTSELALTRPEHDLTMDSLRAQMEAAKRYVDSGLLPKAINTPAKALTVIGVGREIGVPPLYAIRNIHIIEGRPTVSAELLMALVRRVYGPGAIRVKKADNQSCTVEYRESGWDGTSTLTFTMDDAKQAGLAGKDNWKHYPRAMLRSRCVSEVVRMAFPEAIAGLYTPEEMGARVRVTSEGQVELDTEPQLAIVPEITVSDSAALLTPDEVQHWLKAWFGTVSGTNLYSDTARAAFVKDWTRTWERARRTDSLRRALSFMTAEEAAELLDHATALIEADRAEALRQAAEQLGETASDEDAF